MSYAYYTYGNDIAYEQEYRRQHNAAMNKRKAKTSWWFVFFSSLISTTLALIVTIGACVNSYWYWTYGDMTAHPAFGLAALWVFGLLGLTGGILAMTGLCVASQINDNDGHHKKYN